MIIGLVEHSKTMAQMLTKLIRSFGYQIHVFPTPAGLLQTLQAGETFDVIITGLEHDGMSGLELCWHLRAQKATQDIYTIITSATHDVERLSEALDSGADEFIRKPFQKEELWARLRMASRMIEKNRQLRFLADHDPMTHLLNRRAFIDRATEMMQAPSQRLACATLDIDHFKRINDTYGHDIGDEVIIALARAIAPGLPPDAHVARFGGEEFVALFPYQQDNDLTVYGETLCNAARAIRIQTGEQFISFTVSVGLAVHTIGEGLSALLKRADLALYDAKHGGRNQMIRAAA